MAKTTASIPQGTRDFSATVVRKRTYIFETIRRTFALYGFEPLETPALENLETLMGKYGEEGDKLIFKILNNGLERPEKHAAARQAFEAVLQGKNVPALTERALRYDLTIPFARYVAMHHQQLTLPFRRYQIQPVWRADRPQKGRYREFYQCDADIVGSTSLLNEVELASLYAAVFEQLGIAVELRINSRKILAALAAACGGENLLTTITVAIDKLEKIGLEKVKEELVQKGLTAAQIQLIESYLGCNGNNAEKLEQVRQLLGTHTDAGAGLQELETILELAEPGAHCQLVIDLTLARGLNYYTGAIFEVKAKGVQMGSIGGGGRYDNLTGLFGVPGIAGVGISFGVDRIYDVMEELHLFPETVQEGTRVLFFNLGKDAARQAFELTQQLRRQQIATEMYHEPAKIDKQFKYAERKNIPYVVIIGENELASGTCNIKHLPSGNQQQMAITSIAAFDFKN
jgi:histidyl-tRNA synthetase